jgi:hypothetical protein
LTARIDQLTRQRELDVLEFDRLRKQHKEDLISLRDEAKVRDLTRLSDFTYRQDKFRLRLVFHRRQPDRPTLNPKHTRVCVASLTISNAWQYFTISSTVKGN